MTEQRHTRVFETGAIRDLEFNKLDYEAVLSPEVLRAFAVYMDFHRTLSDGSQRAGDDWQKGIPLDVYMKSGTRHFMDVWLAHRGYPISEGRLWALFGLLFNTFGYIHEFMRQHPAALPMALAAALEKREGGS